jgi:signal transduction histidine kinase
VRSLRFRLPAIFLAGVIVVGIVTAVIAVRLFQSSTRSDTLAELRRQAAGLAELYAKSAEQSFGLGTEAPGFAAPLLEQATGTRLYYAGATIFPGQISGLRRLSLGVLDRELLEAGLVQTFEFEPPGVDRTYLAVAQPVRVAGETFGALVVAKPTNELRDEWLALIQRVGLAFLAGVVVAGGLVVYLSRRLTKPVLALSRAADQVAMGRYDAELPRPTTGDEIGHLAERFREMTERLAETEELERNFLMSVSHELRTPLTAIRGHVDALLDGVVEDPSARAASLEVIRSETDRLSRLVGDVLDLAKLDARRFALQEQEVDLRALLEQAYAAFGERARERSLRYEADLAAAPVLATDGDRVLQIVSNLIENAITWTPPGGRVALGLAEAGGAVSVTVSDSGPGIPEPERERIFRPFYTRNGQGTGLGLAIASELAQALGGSLTVDSRVGAGTTFELRLPAGR